jgi:hypothetical protein
LNQIKSNFISHISIKNEAIKAIIELKAEQELEENDEDMDKNTQEKHQKQVEMIVKKLDTHHKENL